MKTFIKRPTFFQPIVLSITFESHWEISDFIKRLKSDNQLPSSVINLIGQLKDFEKDLS